MTISAEVPVAAARGGPVAGAGEHGRRNAEEGTSAADLVLPLVAVGGVGVLAGYGYVRRTRRARTRTTPGVVSPQPPVTPLPVLERQAGAALVQADDCLRTSREELAFVEARFGTGAGGGGEGGATVTEPFVRALREAERELSAAFAIRLRYDRGVPEEDAARRHALAGIVGRCAEAGRRLDAEAPAFDQLRALEEELDTSLGIAEARFRELAGRAGRVDAATTTSTVTVTVTVTGYVEQAKDRLVFATTHLNQARQTADLGDTGTAIRHLRSAEGAITQADVFLNDVDRLANSRTAAAALVPAALTGAEAELAKAEMARATPQPPSGRLHTQLTHAHSTLAAVRQELTGDSPYDPLDALRRIVQAMLPLGAGRDGVLGVAAWLVGRSDVGSADGFVATHRGAVGVAARTRLAEAELLLATDPAAADEPASEARETAEQDVRVHGNPYAGAADDRTGGVGGAVLGGILLGEDPDGGPPLSFGGPATRKRRGLPPT
ncbi:hypothetical protein [Streptomyces sp. NPDC101776]|uniref:hypothetical protein n=1 Tax=Streptomyces sp. NPDC101776 TaxID=3366146 RepID=UPI0037FC2175